MTLSSSRSARGRLLISAAASAALLMTAVSSTFAAPAPQQPTATVVGTVTCGPAEETPAPQALIEVAGSDLVVRADVGGKFTLGQVPTGQTLTIEALSDPSGTVISSRPDVSLQPGETLDIGNLDLSVCPQPAAAPPSSEQATDDTQFAQPSDNVQSTDNTQFALP
jgi:hypothetical protein